MAWDLCLGLKQFGRGQTVTVSRIQMYTHMKTNVATRPIYAVQEKLKAKSSKIPQGNKTNKQQRQ